MWDYEFTDRAARDLASARAWYDRTSITLGNRFVDDILRTIRKIRQRPESFPLVASRQGVRSTTSGRYPYRLYFSVAGSHVDILAVYHTARDPTVWDDPDRQ